MSTEEVDGGHKEGAPWKIVGRFPTFEKADIRRHELLAEEDIQAKVHWMGDYERGFFAVKMRVDPQVARDWAAASRRAEKKRRKAKLNKKRRKK